MTVIKNMLKHKIKQKITKAILYMIKPFIIPILLIIILIILVSCITDMLYVAFNNDDKIDMKKELAYYGTTYEKEKDKQEVKGFFTSVWDFVNKIIGAGGMSEETDWPVERLL